MPNPLSWFFHWGPQWTHKGGVLFNHFAELIVPFALFLPQPVSSIAGVIIIIFQALIFASGNLSWLNLLTAVLAISALDDRFLSAIFPGVRYPTQEPAQVFRLAVLALAALVAILSIEPIRNLTSPNQVMNTIYNRFHFVGTYGAFGSVTRPRYEVVVEGTDQEVINASTIWREYEFKGKPGVTWRTPPQIAPYHLRLDWLMWFAAFSSYEQQSWFVPFLGKLLHGDAAVIGLLRNNPFPDKPPRYVRALRYEYRFTSPQERASTGQWWNRDLVETYVPPVSLRQPAFQELQREYAH
jgi:hypothetical protein